jgi:hypothetical protein
MVNKSWPSKGYALRPKNVLKPLRPHVAIWTYHSTSFSGPLPSRLTIEADTGPRELRVHVKRRNAPGARFAVRGLGVKLELAPELVKRMRGCLNGTGYRMGPWETLLAHYAHKLGLRGDRVWLRRTLYLKALDQLAKAFDPKGENEQLQALLDDYRRAA